MGYKMDDAWLIARCNKFIQKYFDKDFPEVHLKWKKPFVKGHGAEFLEHNGKRFILLNPILRKLGTENYALICLLHEMCHAKLSVHPLPGARRGHGKTFQQEMKRLAVLGAFDSIW